jgi:hypothetical protein
MKKIRRNRKWLSTELSNVGARNFGGKKGDYAAGGARGERGSGASMAMTGGTTTAYV